MEILGTGSYLPDNIVTNDDLAKIVDTNDEWIGSRTGIRSRRISNGESVSDLGSFAAKKAIEDAGVSPEEIDLIIVATMSPETALPNIASKIQKNIGAINATCFDLNAACSGFVFSMNTAHAYLSSGIYKTALIIGSETVSKVIDWTDRSTCVLFGDGAGAVVVKNNTSKKYFTVTGSNGDKGDVLTGGNTHLNNFLTSSNESMIQDDYYMKMDGQEVFKFAVTKVPECISQVLEKAELTPEDIDFFVLHQANIRIISSVAKRLKVDIDKLPVNLNNYGNTSAASIPILLDEMKRSGILKSNMKIVISGFGGGLTWGASLIEV